MIRHNVRVTVSVPVERVQQQPEMIIWRGSKRRGSGRYKSRGDQQADHQAEGSEVTGRDLYPR